MANGSPSTSSAPLGRFFKHSTIYAIGNVLNRIGALLLLPIYTNYLTVAEYGALEFFYVIAAVVTGFLSVGIAHATLRFYFDYEREEDRNSVVTTNLTVSFAITAIGVSLVGFWHEPLARTIFGTERDYSLGMLIVLGTLVLELSSQVCLAYMRAKEHSGLFVAIMFLKLLVQVATNSYLVIVRDMGVEGVLLGNMCAVAFGWIVLVAFVLSKCRYRFDWNKVTPTLKYSFPFLLSTLAGLVSAYADRFLINSLLTLQILGLYALALKFADLLDSFIGEPFNRSYGAFRFTIMKDHDAARIQSDIVRFLFAGLAIAGLAIVYFCHELLVVMSDSAFWPAASVVPVLMIGGALRVLVYPMQTGILYEKRTSYIFYLGVLAAVTSVAGNYVLIQWLGLWGACLALILRELVVLVATNRVSQRFFKVQYDYRRMAIIAVVPVLFYFAAVPLTGLPLQVAIPAKAGIFIVFVAVMLYSGAFRRDEIEWVKAKAVGLWKNRRT
jgi:O-antigen/teichoic acid export membrane protein